MVQRQFRAAVSQDYHIALSQQHAMTTALCITRPSAISVASFTTMVSKRVLILILHCVIVIHVRISNHDNIISTLLTGLVWNGAIGYGCGDTSSLASTWLTVTSTVVEFSSYSTTAVVSTLAAKQFVFSSAPSRSSYTYGYTATAGTSSYHYTVYSGGPDYYGSSAALTAAAIVPL